MKISKNGIDLIKEFEGFSQTIYTCSAGKDTIGYGHVLTEEDNFTQVSEEEAEQLLKKDCDYAEDIINEFVTVKLTQNQFDALVSLVYNIGGNNFVLSNGLVELNNHEFERAALNFFDKTVGFVKANRKIVNGLIRRRQKELELWVQDDEI